MLRLNKLHCFSIQLRVKSGSKNSRTETDRDRWRLGVRLLRCYITSCLLFLAAGSPPLAISSPLPLCNSFATETYEPNTDLSHSLTVSFFSPFYYLDFRAFCFNCVISFSAIYNSTVLSSFLPSAPRPSTSSLPRIQPSPLDQPHSISGWKRIKQTADFYRSGKNKIIFKWKQILKLRQLTECQNNL